MKKYVIAIAFVLLFSSCTKEETATTPKDQEIPVSEFQALKKEVEDLKAQVELLTSGFFEVDGLRFDKNGTLISVPKLESQATEKRGNNTLTTTRKYDTEGRVIEILRDYNTHSEFANVPYFWQKTLYEYSGKTCKTTTQTNKYGLEVGTPYEEVITQATYW